MSNSPAIYNSHRGLWLAAIALAASVVWVGVDAWNSQQQRTQIAKDLTQGDPRRAPEVIRRYGCAGCHTVPGIAGADGQVGGSLADIRKRVYVGGVVNNTGDNLIRWIVSPQTFSPHSAMPVTGISEAEARDVAAYLYAR
jgi:mono/diheme cytochrome c family protein